MKVLLVSAFPPNPQGEANYAGQFVGALASSDPQIVCHVLGQHFEGEEGSEIVPGVVRTMRRSGFGRHLNAIRILLAALRLRPHVIHLQSPVIPDYGGMFGEPVLLALGLMRLIGIRIVITLHSTWMTDDLVALCREKRLSRLATGAFVRYYKGIIRGFVAVSHGFMILTAGESSPAADQFCREYGIRSEKVRNEPHPCARAAAAGIDQYVEKQRLGLEGKRVISTFGFMREDKGFDILIKAFTLAVAGHPDAVLIIGGRAQRPSDRSYVERLRKLCADLPHPQCVRFFDKYLSQEEMSTILNASDVIVIPYLRALGASGPAHHALGREKPLIVSEIGQNLGLRDICATFPAGDVDALCAVLVRLLSDDMQLERLAQQARSYANSHGWNVIAASYGRYYRSLAQFAHARFEFVASEVAD